MSTVTNITIVPTMCLILVFPFTRDINLLQKLSKAGKYMLLRSENLISSIVNGNIYLFVKNRLWFEKLIWLYCKIVGSKNFLSLFALDYCIRFLLNIFIQFLYNILISTYTLTAYFYRASSVIYKLKKYL